MGRRRRSRGFDIEDFIRLVGVLVILGFLAGGTKFLSGVSTAVEAAWTIALLVVVAMVGVAILSGIVLLIVAAVRRSRTNRHEVPVEAESSLGPRPLAAPVTHGPVMPPPAPRFTWELLQELEWRVFERLVTGYFQACGFQAERRRAGADGGVDIVVHKRGMAELFAYVQCKAWSTYTVGVKPVREIFGVMAADGVRQGYFVATRDFTDEARAFARDKPLKLVTGGDLLDKLNNLEESKRTELYREITLGDYTTPTCPSCDIKMVRRESRNGPFWGCARYPKCRQKFRISRESNA